MLHIKPNSFGIGIRNQKDKTVSFKNPRIYEINWKIAMKNITKDEEMSKYARVNNLAIQMEKSIAAHVLNYRHSEEKSSLK